MSRMSRIAAIETPAVAMNPMTPGVTSSVLILSAARIA
jgi:hypothetical protein